MRALVPCLPPDGPPWAAPPREASGPSAIGPDAAHGVHATHGGAPHGAAPGGGAPSDGSTGSGTTYDELDACRAGDRAALERWVERHQRAVFAFLSRMTGPGAHVDDLAQEVFARAFAALPGFDPRGPARMGTWLLGFARLVALEARRHAHRDAEHDLVSAPEPRVADWRSPESALRRRELQTAFTRAAATLPTEQLEAFVLTELHELSFAEAARLLGVPEATAKTRAHRARVKLRALLADTEEERP